MKQALNILVLADYFLPGFRAGGPIQSISNVISQFNKEHQFFVVTRNHDEGCKPYQQVSTNRWSEAGGYRVCYLSSANPYQVWRAIRKLPEQPSLIWLNSYFSRFSIAVLLLRRAGLLSSKAAANIPVLLAPRGEITFQALALKRGKKKIFRFLTRAAGLYRELSYQATSTQEWEHIARLADPQSVYFAPNLLPPATEILTLPSLTKCPGELKLAFVSRIDNMKNLKFLLQVMGQMKNAEKITLDIYGPVNAPGYWTECRAMIAALPAGKVRYHGALARDQVHSAFGASHFFVLPTLHENFGHAIAESWQAARPVMISQNTPWRNLAEQQVGFDLPLDANIWARTLLDCVNMDDASWQHLCRRAYEHYSRLTASSPERSKTAAMFEAVAQTCTRR